MVSLSRQKRRKSNLWQRLFWEHLIRDERDYTLHCDYINYNLVRHGLCLKSQDCPFSSVHRFIAQGFYPNDWGMIEILIIPDNIGDE